MIPKELLKKVRQIEIRTSHMVNDVFAGQYHSAFKGRGMEFEEVRQYQIGDDVRTIDWNVTARSGQPFVKVFREERELTVMLLVDMSRSHLFGTAGQLKRELAAEVCATLAFSAIRNNDKVGLICFTDRTERFVPAKKGTRHVLRVIRELLYHEPEGTGTDIAAAIEHLNRVTTRRSVVFVVSDFQASGYEASLRVARRRHDLIPITIVDPRERDLPNVRFIELTDAETGQTVVVDTSSLKLRTSYAGRASHDADQRRRTFRSMDVETVEVTTGESFVEPLARFFRAREARL
ncbi:MAG: DUF58 domain-containing protein [Phycisphaerae bacterium]|nr:DUF58 domain-containing protein [Phycisphaerae bacterium]